MRITRRQRAAIVEATREIFGEHSVVRLFGSRADDAGQGGDIDPHIVIRGADPLIHEKSQKLFARICAKLGDISHRYCSQGRLKPGCLDPSGGNAPHSVMNSRERLDKALLHCEKIRHELLFSYG